MLSTTQRIDDPLGALAERRPRPLDREPRAEPPRALRPRGENEIDELDTARPDPVDHRMVLQRAGIDEREARLALQAARQRRRQLNPRRIFAEPFVVSGLPIERAGARAEDDAHRYRRILEREFMDLQPAALGERAEHRAR